MDLIRQFNRLAGENKSLIQKALTSASGVGEALVPQHLEQVITNALPRLSPTLAMVEPKFDNQKYHEFKVIGNQKFQSSPFVQHHVSDSIGSVVIDEMFQGF